MDEALRFLERITRTLERQTLLLEQAAVRTIERDRVIEEVLDKVAQHLGLGG